MQLVQSQTSSVLGKETVVLNYELGSFYELNEPGGFVWSLLQTQKTMSVEKIKNRLLEEYEVDEIVCQEELTMFLENLLHEKLIETTA